MSWHSSFEALIPNDFCLRGLLISNVYSNQVDTLQALNTITRHTVRSTRQLPLHKAPDRPRFILRILHGFIGCQIENAIELIKFIVYSLKMIYRLEREVSILDRYEQILFPRFLPSL